MQAPSSYVASRKQRRAAMERIIIERERDDALNVMRGLVNGLILSAGLWVLILWLVL